jgi:hypothetical protein
MRKTRTALLLAALLCSAAWAQPQRSDANADRNGPPSPAAQMQQKQAERFEERAAQQGQKSPAARMQQKKAGKPHRPRERRQDDWKK